MKTTNQPRKFWRMQLDEVKQLYASGLGCRRIAKKLGLCHETIRYWLSKEGLIRHDREGDRSLPFIPSYDEPLGYVLGTLHGDGGSSRKSISLAVSDYDFASEFARNLSIVLHKNPPYKVYQSKRGHFCVSATRKRFALWFRGMALEELETLLLSHKEMATGFLRGIFDSEGSHRKKESLKADNTNKTLLLICQKLLEKHFGIASTIKAYQCSSQWKKNYECFRLRIFNRYMKAFLTSVGFSIHRKQDG